MVDLIKQLEDKKKGCGMATEKIKKRLQYVDILYKCGENPNPEYKYCDECKEIIAILEQAIAELDKRPTIPEIKELIKKGYVDLVKENIDLKSEMQKQRQEILDKIVIEVRYKIKDLETRKIINDILEKLNQSKTEK